MKNNFEKPSLSEDEIKEKIAAQRLNPPQKQPEPVKPPEEWKNKGNLSTLDELYEKSDEVLSKLKELEDFSSNVGIASEGGDEKSYDELDKEYKELERRVQYLENRGSN